MASSASSPHCALSNQQVGFSAPHSMCLGQGETLPQKFLWEPAGFSLQASPGIAVCAGNLLESPCCSHTPDPAARYKYKHAQCLGGDDEAANREFPD